MLSDQETKPKIKFKTWIVLAALAITGQIAWAVENTWFNSFVYETITPDPRPVSWMVAASAIVATLTTIFMGTLSDRTRSKWGKRKPYILIGYVFWGLMTAVFPLTSFIKNVGMAVVMVVLVDCLMTFFGSTANDAAFNAWTADVAPSDNRGRVEGVLNLSLFIAQLISLVAAGIFIENFGYFTFFYIFGGLVMVVGFFAGGAIDETPNLDEPAPTTNYWDDIRGLFDVKTVTENKALFLLLLSVMLLGVGFQVGFPYMLIYVNHTIGVSKSEFAIVGGAVIVGSALLAIPLGILADKVNKKLMLMVSIVLTSLGCFLFSLAQSVPMLAVGALIWQASNMSAAIASTSWLKELLPEESRGRFLGMRMIFWVMLPMLIGPGIGSFLIRNFGIPGMIEGKEGFLAVPLIFQIGALIGLFGLLPLPFLKGNSKKGLEVESHE